MDKTIIQSQGSDDDYIYIISILESQKAVSAHLCSKQILDFDFAQQYTSVVCTLNNNVKRFCQFFYVCK